MATWTLDEAKWAPNGAIRTPLGPCGFPSGIGPYGPHMKPSEHPMGPYGPPMVPYGPQWGHVDPRKASAQIGTQWGHVDPNGAIWTPDGIGPHRPHMKPRVHPLGPYGPPMGPYGPREPLPPFAFPEAISSLCTDRASTTKTTTLPPIALPEAICSLCTGRASTKIIIYLQLLCRKPLAASARTGPAQKYYTTSNCFAGSHKQPLYGQSQHN